MVEVSSQRYIDASFLRLSATGIRSMRDIGARCDSWLGVTEFTNLLRYNRLDSSISPSSNSY